MTQSARSSTVETADIVAAILAALPQIHPAQARAAALNVQMLLDKKQGR